MKLLKYIWSLILDFKKNLGVIGMITGCYIILFLVAEVIPRLISPSPIFHIIWCLCFILACIITISFDYLKNKWNNLK